MSTPRTPCHGESASFDSTDQKDHAFAKSLCLGLRRPDGSQITKPCPMLGPCKKLLDDTLEEYGKGGPRGTWAGILVDAAQITADAKHDRSAERIATEDAAYTEETARRARSAYEAGDRSAWACAGNRTYQRRRMARRRAAKKDAA
jgi:hypothetical protein